MKLSLGRKEKIKHLWRNQTSDFPILLGMCGIVMLLGLMLATFWAKL